MELADAHGTGSSRFLERFADCARVAGNAARSSGPSGVYLDDPELCSGCGERMKIVAAITSPDQDDVIEAVLRALESLVATVEARAKGARSS